MLILKFPTFFSEINWFLNSKADCQVMTKCKSVHSSYMSLSNSWWMCFCSPVRPLLEWHQPAWHPGRAWPNPLFQTMSVPTCSLKNSRQLWDKSSFVLSVFEPNGIRDSESAQSLSVRSAQTLPQKANQILPKSRCISQPTTERQRG